MLDEKIMYKIEPRVFLVSTCMFLYAGLLFIHHFLDKHFYLLPPVVVLCSFRYTV